MKFSICFMTLVFSVPTLLFAETLTYPSEVTDIVGTFGAPSELSSDIEDTFVVLGPPDGQFIQLSDNSAITIRFSKLQESAVKLRIFTIDSIQPAAARVEISANGVSFNELLPEEGELFYDSNQSGFLDITFNPMDIQFVRITDLPGKIDGDFFAKGTVGFDLDALAIVSASLLGDVNCDGLVDLLDVAPFIEAVSSGVNCPNADINQDGAVDLLDVGPFIDLLAG